MASRSEGTLPNSAPFAAAVIVVPFAPLTGHLLLFGLSGAVWLVGPVLIAVLGAYMLVTRPRWRARPAVEIARSFIRNRMLTGTVMAGMVVLEAMALRAGIPARRLRKEALTALDDPNPCAVAGRERELYVDLGQGIKFGNRLAKCEQGRRAAEAEARAKRCQAIADSCLQGSRRLGSRSTWRRTCRPTSVTRRACRAG